MDGSLRYLSNSEKRPITDIKWIHCTYGEQKRQFLRGRGVGVCANDGFGAVSVGFFCDLHLYSAIF